VAPDQAPDPPAILLLSHAETDILALRSVLHRLPPGFPPVRAANPARLEGPAELAGVAVVVLRLLGGRRSWEAGFDELRHRCIALRVPLIAVAGEATPDAELAGWSTVAGGITAEVHRYLSAGGPANVASCLRFVADTVLVGGFGFDAPAELEAFGIFDAACTPRRAGRPLVGVVFYRAHMLAGNTTFVEDLSAALDHAGADVVAVYTYSLRPDADGQVPALAICAERRVDVLITTVLAMGSAGSDDGEDWDVSRLSGLGVPVLQAPACNSSRETWHDSVAGLGPLDVASGVALPEFDGRIIGPAFAFREEVDDGADLGVTIIATRADPERTARVAGLAVALANLRSTPAERKRVAVVLSAYPTKRSRLGNAVGLDTPASAILLLHALRDSGVRVDRIPGTGDQLMAELGELLTYATPDLSDAQAAKAVGRLAADDYRSWFGTIPESARSNVEELWGPAPGEVYLNRGELCFSGLDLGGVLVAIQPPRGFGADPIGTYHAPDMPPPHHYLAFYRWLAETWKADAVVHLGKHGTLEWLPGKANAPSASCFPDLALGNLPLIYPFVMNDPGEGAQAKRRAHAVMIDHLPPPMTRADTYDDLAKLERLLDAYAQAQAMDPAKLPALRQQVWELVVEAEIHRDLGMSAQPGEDFDSMVLHVDGYLCALKDAQIRGGLHTLGQAPQGEALVDTVLAITRLPQGSVPSLRATVAEGLGVDLASERRAEVDSVEAGCRRAVDTLAAAGWQLSAAGDDPTLRWVAGRLVPDLRRCGDEIANILAALEGCYVPAGPSGAPTRGGAHALPTGRNFYSVDPKALPTPLAWEVGCKLADALIERYVTDNGAPPLTVGLVLWGTAAMRTGGDDAAEALALLGVRPRWAAESGRVIGLEVIPLSELGRARVDVTLRISGFFRDAFPHLVALVDDAVGLVAGLDEAAELNPVRAAGAGDARIFGPPPGGYGSGILPVIERGSWRTDADLAEVYLAWSGFAYRRGVSGVPAGDQMRRRFAAIEVAVKNQDNREHDIFDSDDYLQDHGGMVAAVRALSGRSPMAVFGDSADPSNPKVRALGEEAARVVRSRVLNPRWISAMRNHGYKGAFELAATVDYLFGYDATTGIVEDWMYERVTDAYVGDPQMRRFFQDSNPTALRSIAERLLEAAQRQMWSEPSESARKVLVDAILETDGWEEAAT
jgi:cobaltochelatase CobN